VRAAALGMLADVAVVLVFVLIGRANHHAGETVAGAAVTAWPFLAGLAAGELAARSWRRPAALVPTGLIVWLATVGLGQPLRVVSGQGTDPVFIAVSAAILGLFLLGWRTIVLLAGRSPRGPLAGLPAGTSVQDRDRMADGAAAGALGLASSGCCEMDPGGGASRVRPEADPARTRTRTDHRSLGRRRTPRRDRPP